MEKPQEINREEKTEKVEEELGNKIQKRKWNGKEGKTCQDWFSSDIQKIMEWEEKKREDVEFRQQGLWIRIVNTSTEEPIQFQETMNREQDKEESVEELEKSVKEGKKGRKKEDEKTE